MLHQMQCTNVSLITFCSSIRRVLLLQVCVLISLLYNYAVNKTKRKVDNRIARDNVEW